MAQQLAVSRDSCKPQVNQPHMISKISWKSKSTKYGNLSWKKTERIQTGLNLRLRHSCRALITSTDSAALKKFITVKVRTLIALK